MNKKLYLAVLASAALPQLSQASGFAIIEHSASGVGQAFAGASVVAEDPSTIYFNPAGMTYLNGSQATVGLHVIKPTGTFEDEGSHASLRGGAIPVAIGNDDGGDVGSYNFVPNTYYMTEFGDNFRFGLGITAPFGMSVTYDDEWLGRYTSTESDLKTVNINPSLAFKASDKLSVGLGANLQYIKATLNKQIMLCGHPQLAPTCNPTSTAQLLATDAKQELTGDTWSLGFNLGFIYELTDATRVGVSYRSPVVHKLEGTVTVETQSGVKIVNSDIEAGIETPASFSISLSHQLNSRTLLLADVTHFTWSNFEELRIELPAGPDDVTEERWGDSLRYSLGLSYQYSDRLRLRTGIAYDKTPIDDVYRTSRVPGDNRTWLAFGFNYQVSDQLSIDAGYTHLWTSDAKIDEEFTLLNGAGNGQLKGRYDASVDIVSVQATWKF